MKDRPDRPAGFLGRWAQRKSASRRAGQPSAEPVDAIDTIDAVDAVDAAPPVADPPSAEDSPPAAAADKPPLPSIDSLTPDSDFSAFMSPDVDAALRRAALRKLFHSPAMNVTDGLDDYAEDYTAFTPLGDMITADMRHQMDVEAERARKRAEAARAEADATPAVEEGAAPGDEPRQIAAGEEAGDEASQALDTEGAQEEATTVVSTPDPELATGDDAVDRADAGEAEAPGDGEAADKPVASRDAAEPPPGDPRRG